MPYPPFNPKNNIILTEKTYSRIIEFSRPLEDADAVITRLLDGLITQKEISFSHEPPEPGHGDAWGDIPATQYGSPTLPGKKCRAYNNDVLSQYLRPAYVGAGYRLACYDLLSRHPRCKTVPWLVDKLFKFPNDDQRPVRIERATASLRVALREHKAKSANEPRLFIEPKPWHFTINPAVVKS